LARVYSYLPDSFLLLRQSVNSNGFLSFGVDGTKFRNILYISGGRFDTFTSKTTMTTPPPVPKYWHFATVLTDHSKDVRKHFTDMCNILQLDISYSEPWIWHILVGEDCIECNVFYKEEHSIIDINLLHGDRWKYKDTLERIRACWQRLMVSQEHSLLVDDFHKKKCEEGRGKKQFKPRSKADNANYNDKYLELMKYCMGRLKGFCDNKKKRRWIKSIGQASTIGNKK